MVGKLEELVLAAAIRAGENALASEIFERLVIGKPDAAFGAVYTTLTRLTTKGYVEERKKTDEAGRDRRTFSVTGIGRLALIESYNATASIAGQPAWGACYVG